MEGGKWGLVIIASAFMIQFLAFGATAAIGVYNIELLDYFPGKTIQVSLIGSLNFGIFLGSGPIVSFLMTKFSYRKIALFGSVLIVAGLLGMPLFPYIPAMCFCFGVLTGFGSCCTYIPSHVLSGLYYDKYRSLATGVTTSGSGLGGAVMPVLCGLLIDVYSWKGSLIFVAGLCLHLLVLSSLLRAPPALAEKEDEIEVPHAKHEGSHSPTASLLEKENVAITDNKETGHQAHSENVNHNFHGHGMNKQDPHDALSNGKDRNATENVPFHMKSHKEVHQVKDSGEIVVSDGNVKVNPEEVKLIHRKDGDLSAASKIQSLSHASLHSVGATRGSIQVVLDENMDFRSSRLHLSQKKASDVKKVPNASRHIFIFTNYGFNIYFFSNIMWNASASIIGAFAPKFLTEKGQTPMEAAWLIGAFGFGVFVGGIMGGVFGNFKWVNRQVLYTLANLVMGVVMIVFPYLGDILWYGSFLVLGGIAFGVILGLLIVVLTDLIGIESLGNGLGYLMLSNGLGTFIGPPMAGALKEMTHGFESAIILAGVLGLFGGFIMFLMPCKRICQRQIDANSSEGDKL